MTCLPGALTMIRLAELIEVGEHYFGDLPTEKVFDYHRFHLGEDRYLTNLLLEKYPAYSVGFCSSARAKTEAPGTWAIFLKQRRRWLLGAFANEVFFLGSWKLWLKVPFLVFYKLCDFSSRSAAFFLYIVAFQLISGVRYQLTQTFIIWAPLFTNWLLILIFALILKRFKIFYMFPIMILLNPWMCKLDVLLTRCRLFHQFVFHLDVECVQLGRTTCDY